MNEAPKVGGTWTFTEKVLNPDPSQDDMFGTSVAIDSLCAVIGAPFESPVGLSDTGAGYVFEKQAGTWANTAKLEVPNSGPQRYGTTVALSGTNALLGGTTSADEAHAFRMEGSTWSHAAVLLPSGLGGEFARDISVWGDTAVVGEPALSGHAYVFILNKPLYGCPGSVSVSAGGAQTFTIEAGDALASELYLVLGSMSGDTPGFTFQGFLIPLNFDPYFTFTTENANNPPPLLNTFGPLDAEGKATGFFVLPAGFGASFVGTTLHHAFVVLDIDPLALKFVSNSVQLDLVP